LLATGIIGLKDSANRIAIATTQFPGKPHPPQA
jgi:hypothetical protein